MVDHRDRLRRLYAYAFIAGSVGIDTDSAEDLVGSRVLTSYLFSCLKAVHKGA